MSLSFISSIEEAYLGGLCSDWLTSHIFEETLRVELSHPQLARSWSELLQAQPGIRLVTVHGGSLQVRFDRRRCTRLQLLRQLGIPGSN